MKHALTDIAGIGESTAELLAEHGIDSVKALRKGGLEKLAKVPGFGEKRAVAVLAAADDLKAADKEAKLEAKLAAKAEKKLAKADKADKEKKTKKKKKKK